MYCKSLYFFRQHVKMKASFCIFKLACHLLIGAVLSEGTLLSRLKVKPLET